jgi:hypothetical protein
MLKRFLFSSAVVLGFAAPIACSGDSGGGGGLTDKPTIATDRDVIAAALTQGYGSAETLLVTNQGKQDLVISGMTLTGDPSLINPRTLPLPDGGTTTTSVFRLVSPYVIQLLPDGGVTTGAEGNTLKSAQSGFVSLQFNAPPAAPNSGDAGTKFDAGLTITSNADNFPTKQVGLEINSNLPR